MGIFDKFKKKETLEISSLYETIENWLNAILVQDIPTSVVALNFNLYDDGESKWSIELVGTESFDLEDQDWCCDEVFDFGTRETPFAWKEEKEWSDILNEMIQILKKYLNQGCYSEVIKKYKGIGIGFVDGDVEVLFSR